MQPSGGSSFCRSFSKALLYCGNDCSAGEGAACYVAVGRVLLATQRWGGCCLLRSSGEGATCYAALGRVLLATQHWGGCCLLRSAEEGTQQWRGCFLLPVDLLCYCLLTFCHSLFAIWSCPLPKSTNGWACGLSQIIIEVTDYKDENKLQRCVLWLGSGISPLQGRCHAHVGCCHAHAGSFHFALWGVGCSMWACGIELLWLKSVAALLGCLATSNL